MSPHWPAAELDTVRRLRVLAGTTPGVLYAEEHIDAAFDVVWRVASDLEVQAPRLITDVATFEITDSHHNRLEARARSRTGLRARFEIVLEPGWCLMQSRFLVAGMAAVPEGDGTRFAGLGALRLPGARLLGPPNRWLLTRQLGHGAISRLAEQVRSS